MTDAGTNTTTGTDTLDDHSHDLLRVENLTAGYLGVPAVRDINVHVATGEVVALLGPNGAGKSTTLSAIAGLIKPIEGSITLGGNEIGGQPAFKLARIGVSLVPEDRALFFGLTVRENLRLARRGASMPIEEILDLLPELTKCINRQAGVLSGGEQQMLAVGRALISKPRLLLVDEMSLGLAPIIVERLLPVLQRVAEQINAGVLFVEQHFLLALGIANRAYVLNNGRMVLEGPADELIRRRDLLEASYLGEVSSDVEPPQPSK